MLKAGRNDTPSYKLIVSELLPVELLPGTEYLLAAFYDLSNSRGMGMGGPMPINWTEIKAYCELMDQPLSKREILSIKDMDRVFLEETYSTR